MSNPVSNAATTTANQADTDEIDLLALLMTLLNGWKIIVTFIVLGILLGITYNRYVQPTYQTDALLQIDEKSPGITALGSNISELVGESNSVAKAERELIKSRMVLKPVVEKLHLDIQLIDPEIGLLDRIAQASVPTQISTEEGVFLQTADGVVQVSNFEVPVAYQDRPFNLVKTASGFELSIEINKEFLSYTGKIGTPTNIKSPEGDINIMVVSLADVGHAINIINLAIPSAINILSNNLEVSERGKQTGIVQLTLSGLDQQQISRVLAEVVDVYIYQNIARSAERTITTIGFMELQIPKLKQKLEQSEEIFNTFREQYGTIDVSKEAEILLEENSLVEQQLSELNLKQAELLTYYTNKHPLVIEIKDQLLLLQKRHQEIKDTIGRLPEVQRKFLQLSQDVAINREIYLTMLKNYEQLKIARAGEIGYVRVVDMPINTYRPIAPNKPLILVLSLILGAILGSVIVLLKSLLHNTVKDPDRLEQKTGVPVIATIPRSKVVINSTRNNKSNRHLLALVESDGLSYEGIKSLRTSLMFTMPSQSKMQSTFGDHGLSEAVNKENKQGKIIAISGESPGIGKSFIASNLAETFSQLDKKVLIIDGDMRRGQVHKFFNVDRGIGLANYLVDSQITLSEVIQPTGFELIDLIPRGQHPPNPASLLSTDKFVNMLLQLVADYDFIIIDTPPILAVSDAMMISQYADKVLMVARYNASIEGQVAYAAKQMQKANIIVNGIVLNDMVQGITDRYNYHYSYAYGSSDK